MYHFFCIFKGQNGVELEFEGASCCCEKQKTRKRAYNRAVCRRQGHVQSIGGAVQSARFPHAQQVSLPTSVPVLPIFH